MATAIQKRLAALEARTIQPNLFPDLDTKPDATLRADLATMSGIMGRAIDSGAAGDLAPKMRDWRERADLA